jgi:hypothetical protein
LFALCNDDNEAIGMLRLNECTAIYAGGRFGEISEFYVAPEGRSKGVGAKLLAAARDFGISRIWKRLEVGAPDVPRWDKTVAFYLSYGDSSYHIFMRARWFKKHGYQKADRSGISVLLWKPFSDDASPPQWIKAKRKPELIQGKVVVTALANGWCSGIKGMIERAWQISSEFEDKVVYREIDPNSRVVARKWDLSDGLFVNEKNIYKGPPLPYDKIKKIIGKKFKDYNL